MFGSPGCVELGSYGMVFRTICAEVSRSHSSFTEWSNFLAKRPSNKEREKQSGPQHLISRHGRAGRPWEAAGGAGRCWPRVYGGTTAVGVGAVVGDG
jgi:hypothetical protein